MLLLLVFFYFPTPTPRLRFSRSRSFYHSSSDSSSSSNALFFLSNVMLPTFFSPIPLSETVFNISMSICSETFPSFPCREAFKIIRSTPFAFDGFTSFTRASRSRAFGSKIEARKACRSSSNCCSWWCRSDCSWAEVGALVRSIPCPPCCCCAKAKACFARASSWNDTQKRKEVNTFRGETKGFTREIFIYIKRFAQKRTACVRAFTTRGNQQTRTIIILSSLSSPSLRFSSSVCVCSRSLRAHFNERQNEARDENESERTVHCICLGFRYSSKGVNFEREKTKHLPPQNTHQALLRTTI